MTDVRINRLNAIIDALLQCGGAVGCTRKEIAAMLFKADGSPLKKTPYIANLLDQLVRDGYAVVTEDTTVWPRRLRYSPSQALLEGRGMATA